MEQVMNKLSEIETTAKHIMQEATDSKHQLSEEYANKRKAYDQELTASLDDKVAQIRAQLETDKNAQLEDLRKNTTDVVATMDSYYDAHHEELAEQLFQQIIKHNK